MTTPQMPLRRPRPRWPLAAALAVGTLGAASSFAWSASPSDLDAEIAAQDPVRIAAAHDLLRELPAPTGARLDATATACGSPADYCASAVGSTPDGLLADVAGLLRDRGARVGGEGCAEAEPYAVPGRCTASATFDGARMRIAADDVTGLGLGTPAWVRIQVAEVVPAGAVDPAPLGTWESLALVPPAWGKASCVQPVTGGCSRYEGSFEAPRPHARTEALVRRRLEVAGYRLDAANCRADGCMLAAARFRGPAGTDPAIVTVAVRRVSADRTSVRVIAGV